ncbi:MAG: MBL fold metallo-hydrolase [Acutalibacteraceae bacterium]|nr:MBL fold metallo-hydrolase [Acutalibacteraceae bacterium]
MKSKAILSLILVFILMFSSAVPVLAAGTAQITQSVTVTADNPINRFTTFFKNIIDRIVELWNQIDIFFEVKSEGVQNTKNVNAIHMLKSVTDTIGDSFIITTDDGKVIVFDGGMTSETDYFLEYLRQATGNRKPHIDAWFLSHPHDDHCEVFLNVIENYGDALTFDKVYVNFAPIDFYSDTDEEADRILHDYARLRPLFEAKEQILSEGDIFNIGTAKFTVLYSFDSAFTGCNDSSLVFRMELGGKSVMFTGDSGVKSGQKILKNWGNSDMLKSDICKMAHHGQGGCDRDFYEAVSPEICLWPTPSWVWDNRNGNLQTLEVRAWMDELGVQKNYVAKDGSQLILL